MLQREEEIKCFSRPGALAEFGALNNSLFEGFLRSSSSSCLLSYSLCNRCGHTETKAYLNKLLCTLVSRNERLLISPTLRRGHFFQEVI